VKNKIENETNTDCSEILIVPPNICSKTIKVSEECKITNNASGNHLLQFEYTFSILFIATVYCGLDWN
jgi:hypothetical protein